MKCVATSTVLSIAALSSCALAAITVHIGKSNESSSHPKREYLSTRANIYSPLINNITGGSYVAQVTVGTPPQKQNLVIDTGSSDVWMLSSQAAVCADRRYIAYYGGCSSVFDDSASTSFKVVDPNAFDISYLDGSQAQGDYVTDNFEIGGTSIKGLQMGFATDANLTRGIMGIGYTTNQASNDPRNPAPFTYPSIIDTMVEQKLIGTKAYSLYLDDLQSSTGSIIFGGLDSDKYHGNLLEVPLVPAQFPNGSVIYTTFTVALTSFSITDENGAETQLTNSKRYPVVLDSGTTITYLPDTVAGRLYSAIGAVDDTENSGIVFADCNLNPSIKFNYQFGGSSGITIEVPLSELLFSIQDIADGSSGFLPNLPFSEPCAFGIFPDAGGPSILGDTFLRSAYVVYDISNDVVALAQTNFNSTTSSIVDFEASQTAIPNVSGVASTVDVTQTATGILGDGGGGVKSRTSGLSGTGTGDSGDSGPTATVTVTPSGNGAAATTTSTSSSTRNAGVKTVPAFDGRSTIVIGLWGAFALLGGALFLA